MARRYLMTWKPKEARWRKMHKGEWHGVSCEALCVPPTKEASWRAANAWWEDRRRSLESTKEEDVAARAEAIRSIANKEDRETTLDAICGPGTFSEIAEQARSIVRSAKQPSPERTVGKQAESWRQLLLGSCQSDGISEPRYDSYCREIRKFVDWIGENSPVDSIDESKIEEFFKFLSAKVGKGEFAKSTAHTIMMTAQQFISRLADNKLIQTPSNLRHRRFRFNQGRATKIETFTVDEVRAMLAACEGWSDRTRLYILAALNFGAYQNDIAELRNDEVDWPNGIVRRYRSKTRDSGGLIVSYKLWPETLSLLRRHRERSGDLVLATDRGNPLVRRWIEDGKMRRYDLIHASWMRMAKRMGRDRNRLGFKHLRKTAASILGTHPQFKYYSEYYLSHAPRGVAQVSYVAPSDAEFFQALDWLRGEILGD